MKSRYAALLLLSVGPAIAFRTSGATLWMIYGAVVAIAAAIAAWELHQDGILRDVFRREGFDLMIGLAVAATLYASVFVAWKYWIAPASVAGGVLSRCRVDGPMLPRLDVHGLDRVAEWLRGQVCKGYGSSLGIDLRVRGPVIFVVAALEEIAWRGGVQQLLSEKLGSTRGWLAASLLFALVHAFTPTPALALLALPCGLAWGALYRFRGRLLTGVFSHAVFSMYLFSTMPLVRFS